jgi:hypothetical protein
MGETVKRNMEHLCEVTMEPTVAGSLEMKARVQGAPRWQQVYPFFPPALASGISAIDYVGRGGETGKLISLLSGQGRI